MSLNLLEPHHINGQYFLGIGLLDLIAYIQAGLWEVSFVLFGNT